MFKKENNFNATNSLAHTKWNCKYHIECLHQNTGEKYSMKKKGLRYEKY